MSQSVFSIAFGVGTRNREGQWLEVLFPRPLLRPSAVFINRIKDILGYTGGNQVIDFNFSIASDLARALKYISPEQSALLVRLAESHKPTVACILEHDTPPATVPGAYLKLQLISHRLCKPHEINLTDLFNVLPNVAWTNRGAVDIEEVAALQLEERIKGRMLEVFSVDKLPKLTDYVVPKGIHIADAARVRLGAYVGEGTVVLHEGSINFNAGTHGSSTIDGYIASGVVVGADSTLQGGCSMASSGGQPLVSVGHHCVINSHADVGISLGNRNTIEAGLHLTADTTVTVVNKAKQTIKVVAASELALLDDLSFYRNTETGTVECLNTAE
ncbi:2,3,4,5-tetrahydropyridine-2,6-dicarboxylate N-succinyltransferase [Denitrificimonas sp. JX-1]|uniref:2,3,4,5-tetrahydropyridine-2,6-dicarboxylate N-succinyltransferase n=1 Tax=Denitrificimonas halotolerans TaxID=3098930 RepID=A0ABU5GN26_9GAMM|nr:2,3,4,5-tetrahydropyridine-2,6-dicarboxylate N-succinyltransferase [Denitrificimonas sp. JX-1]MDY7218104.1 2,3,4,5-tetrahydropyridine-2,6-dicarboxylate N-succinyltransferase [Denitrificimonas sp. JX-1]